MKFLRFSSVALAASLMLPMASHAQVQMQFDGVKFPGGDPVGSAATGPYIAHSTAPVVSPVFDIYCIDFDHTAQTSWPARFVTFAQAVGTEIAATDRQLGTGVTLAKLRTAAYLSQQFGSTPQNQWDDVHGAIWSLFSSGFSVTVGMTTQLGLATTAGAATNSSLDNEFVLVYDNRAWDNNFAASQLNQAFLTDDGNTDIDIVTPEPSTYVLMGAGLLAIGFARRRRRAA